MGDRKSSDDNFPAASFFASLARSRTELPCVFSVSFVLVFFFLPVIVVVMMKKMMCCCFRSLRFPPICAPSILPLLLLFLPLLFVVAVPLVSFFSFPGSFLLFQSPRLTSPFLLCTIFLSPFSFPLSPSSSLLFALLSLPPRSRFPISLSTPSLNLSYQLR